MRSERELKDNLMRRACLTAFACLALMACEQGSDVMKQIDKQQAERAQMALDIAEKSKTFLVTNGARPGVTTTTSGLQYEVVRAVAADLPKPAVQDRVTVMYEGKLVDGKVFDSSYARKEPIAFTLNEVIPGWTEGLQLMKPGEEFTFYIPSDIGYGARGAGADIPPNSALIFRVELLKFERPDGTTVNPR
jgi:FKBP-type peptidyl-prolyl cis-trans isomerase FkpA